MKNGKMWIQMYKPRTTLTHGNERKKMRKFHMKNHTNNDTHDENKWNLEVTEKISQMPTIKNK